MSDLKNPLNQVHRAADGRYHILWRGALVNAPDGGRMLTFATEDEAREYLARCEAADRATGPNPALHGVQTQVYANMRRPFRFPPLS
jgi:hypothetical protein